MVRWLFDGIRLGAFELAISTEILQEYEEIIGRHYSPILASNVVEMLPNLENSIWVTPYFKWNLLTNDVDDNKFVDCAINGQADYIITHDKHFDALKNISFPRVEVLRIHQLEEIMP